MVDMDRRWQVAVDSFVAAAEALGIEVTSELDDDSGADAVIRLRGGPEFPVRMKVASLVTGVSAADQLRRWSEPPRGGPVDVVVADRITADGREFLTRAGWSWLDLRGHMRLVGPGLIVDADVPVPSVPLPERAGIVGRVGVEVATQLLLDPDGQVGIRSTAAALGRSPSAVSRVLHLLRAAGLVDDERRPAVPDLFWELAAHWKPVSHPLAGLPGPGRGPENVVLRLGLDDVETTTGWALSDTVAAAVYGAPVAMRADHARDFYVPDEGTVRRAIQVLGSATTRAASAGRVRLAPVPAVCSQRVDASTWADEPWPLANPLFVALDLAQDPGRGREILEGWTPEAPWRRVW
jgi:hypothetical protein